MNRHRRHELFRQRMKEIARDREEAERIAAITGLSCSKFLEGTRQLAKATIRAEEVGINE